MALPIFKGRCSKLSALAAVKGLGATAETYVKEWLTKNWCGYEKEFSNKYTKKGLAQEDEGIDLIASVEGLGMLIKNTKREGNDWYDGECDILLPKKIKDVKCSWDAYTFPKFEDELTNYNYICQGNGYMDIFDREEYDLQYCLVDAPQWLIDSEYWSAHYKIQKETGVEFVDNEVNADLYEQVRSKMIHSHLPDEQRIKTFTFKRDDKLIALMRSRVEEVREVLIPKLLKR